jgi:hypothetical protein
MKEMSKPLDKRGIEKQREARRGIDFKHLPAVIRSVLFSLIKII